MLRTTKNKYKQNFTSKMLDRSIPQDNSGEYLNRYHSVTKKSTNSIKSKKNYIYTQRNKHFPSISNTETTNKHNLPS